MKEVNRFMTPTFSTPYAQELWAELIRTYDAAINTPEKYALLAQYCSLASTIDSMNTSLEQEPFHVLENGMMKPNQLSRTLPNMIQVLIRLGQTIGIHNVGSGSGGVGAAASQLIEWVRQSNVDRKTAV